MRTYHAAVWLDHNEARIFHVEKGRFDEEVVVPERPHRKLHRKTGPGAVSGRRVVADPEYLHAIAKVLEESQEILVMGPSTAEMISDSRISVGGRPRTYPPPTPRLERTRPAPLSANRICSRYG